ncbi:MAG: hypothetical protein LBD53_00650 [Tannerella sp.]|nr:hypothetical protein [Tannerella sp.]
MSSHAGLRGAVITYRLVVPFLLPMTDVSSKPLAELSTLNSQLIKTNALFNFFPRSMNNLKNFRYLCNF